MSVQLAVHGTQDAISLADSVFAADFNASLIHQVITAYLAGGRQGTKRQKSRSDVRGGGAKPWRQKGTGRARAGTIRSPIWRGGGITFAARPRDHTQKVNKKMYRAALRCIISELVRSERLLIVENLTLAEPKTKLLSAELTKIGVADVLLLTHEVDRNLYLAARNLPAVQVLEIGAIDPVSLLRYQHVLLTRPALEQLQERLA